MSIESSSVTFDINKRDGDLMKLTHGLSGLLSHLADVVDNEWSAMENLEVVGFLTSGSCLHPLPHSHSNL